MSKSNQVQIGQMIAMAKQYQEAGILFVPIPIVDDGDFGKLAHFAMRRLNELEKREAQNEKP